jgi:type III secretion protein D
MNQAQPMPIPFARPNREVCLQVLSGLHQHARLQLTQQPWHLVGAAEDCDVVLRDAGIHAHHLLVSVDTTGPDPHPDRSPDPIPETDASPEPRWTLRALDAALWVNGAELPAGESTTVVGSLVCQLGSVRFGLGQPHSAAWRAMLAAEGNNQPTDASVGNLGSAGSRLDSQLHSPFDSQLDPQFDQQLHAAPTHRPHGLHGDPPTMAPQPDSGPAPAADTTAGLFNERHHPHALSSQRTTLRRVLWGGGIGLLMGMTSAFAWVMHSQVQQERESKGGVERIVAELELKELQIARGQNGHVRLVGTVATEALRSRLQTSLKQAGLEPTLDVVTGERLAAGVQDSFRQKGLPVQARYVGAGRVLVAGAAATPASEQVIRDILAKTPSLSHIELSPGTGLADATTAPRAGPPPGSPPAAVAAPGPGAQADANAAVGGKAGARGDPKRVVAVVGGDEPYLLTQDGARYLVGAVLPDGSLVQSVDGHTVNFVRNGRHVQVEF